MSAIDIIKRRLKEDRVPDAPWPDELGEKKKRPREVAFMDVNLCFAPPMTVRYIQTRFAALPRTRVPDACAQRRSFPVSL